MEGRNTGPERRHPDQADENSVWLSDHVAQRMAAIEESSLPVLSEAWKGKMNVGIGYWQAVNDLWVRMDPEAADKAVCPDFMAASTKVIWLCSLTHKMRGIKAGRIFVVSPYLAAKLIIDETHRLATRAEIAGWKKEQQCRRVAEKSITVDPNEWRLRYNELRRLWDGKKQHLTKNGAVLIAEGLKLLWQQVVNHPGLERLRLALYRPTMDDFDSDRFWKLTPAQRAKCQEWARVRIFEDLNY
jgi:hypothetical protein